MLQTLLDKSILFSFDRTGYRRHARDFDPADLDVDLADRHYLVTGANSGLGLATARGLARRGGRVWMLCRSAEWGEVARDQIRAATGNPEVHLELLDLADLGGVRRFGERFVHRPVDVLIHNAGVLPLERQITGDGLELTAAVHLVAPLLLTRLLLPALEQSDDARVIQISSGGMYGVGLDVEKIFQSPEPYDGVKTYARTKRGQVVLNELLSVRLAPLGITTSAMHPGWADTPGVEKSLPRFHRLLGSRLRTPEEGADTILWLAMSRRAGFESGRFWFDRKQVPTHLLPWTRESEEERRGLWTECCRLAGIDPEWSP